MLIDDVLGEAIPAACKRSRKSRSGKAGFRRRDVGGSRDAIVLRPAEGAAGELGGYHEGRPSQFATEDLGEVRRDLRMGFAAVTRDVVPGDGRHAHRLERMTRAILREKLPVEHEAIVAAVVLEIERPDVGEIGRCEIGKLVGAVGHAQYDDLVCREELARVIEDIGLEDVGRRGRAGAYRRL